MVMVMVVVLAATIDSDFGGDNEDADDVGDERKRGRAGVSRLGT